MTDQCGGVVLIVQVAQALKNGADLPLARLDFAGIHLDEVAAFFKRKVCCHVLVLPAVWSESGKSERVAHRPILVTDAAALLWPPPQTGIAACLLRRIMSSVVEIPCLVMRVAYYVALQQSSAAAGPLDTAGVGKEDFHEHSFISHGAQA